MSSIVVPCTSSKQQLPVTDQISSPPFRPAEAPPQQQQKGEMEEEKEEEEEEEEEEAGEAKSLRSFLGFGPV